MSGRKKLPARRTASMFVCRCGETIAVGHVDGTDILCDDCWTKRQQQEAMNFPEWGGNNAKKGQA